MSQYKRGPYDQFVRFRSQYRRAIRMLFPSPMEVAFIKLFGGLVVTIPIVRHWHTGFKLAFVVWWPRLFRQENVRREVRVGKHYADLAQVTPYCKKVIEVDSWLWHTDVLKEQQRDGYLKARGARILHIRVDDIVRKPDEVRQKVTAFLTR